MDRRQAHWAIAYVAVGLSAALATRQGTMIADTPVDAVIRGAVMFVIAVLGCHGWAWAARTAKDGHRVWGIIAGCVMTVAMVVTLIGGATFIYSAAGEKEAGAGRALDAYERAKIELGKLDAARAKLGAHRSRGEIEPEFKTARADPRFRNSEDCDQPQGPKARTFCETFRKLESEYATTGEDERLASLAAPYTATVSQGKPSKAASMGAWLAEVLGISEQMGSAIFALLCTIALDAGAVVAVLTAELRAETPIATPIVVEQKVSEPYQDPLPQPQRPLLVSSTVRTVPDIIAEIMQPAARQRVELTELHKEYQRACKREGLDAVSFEQFEDPAMRFCNAAKIETTMRAGKTYLLGVELVDSKRRLGPKGRSRRVKP